METFDIQFDMYLQRLGLVRFGSYSVDNSLLIVYSLFLVSSLALPGSCIVKDTAECYTTQCFDVVAFYYHRQRLSFVFQCRVAH